MKKSTKIILIIAICLLCAGLVLTAIGYLCGASPRQIFHDNLWTWTSYDDDGGQSGDHHGKARYDNDFDESNAYSIDPAGIDSLYIDWIDGDIEIIPYDGDQIYLEESCKAGIDEDNCLRYRVKNRELYISCCREASYEIGFFSSSSDSPGRRDLNKKLVVKVPKALAAKLDTLEIDAVSSDITVNGFTLNEFCTDTVSGSITVLRSSIDEIDTDTVSGNIDLALLHCPNTFNADSTSGNITLQLPSGSSFLLDFETVSGAPEIKGFDADCLYDEDGSYEYQAGSGRCEFTADTVSGDLTITEAGKK